MGLYSTVVPMVYFMCFCVLFIIDFLKLARIKNTDSTMEHVAKIFNSRRKEERERGAESHAMDT